MVDLNDYKKHIQVLKLEQKIARMKRELETADYDDGCPVHGEDECTELRKVYDKGFVDGLFEALSTLGVVADTPQTEEQRKVQEAEHRMANIIADMDTPQTERSSE